MLNGVLSALGAGALWGMVFIAPYLLPDWAPVELMMGRYGAYGAIALLMLGSGLPGILRRLGRSDAWALLRHALSGNVVYYLMLASAVQLAGVAPTSLIIGLLPVTVTLAGARDHGALPLARLAWPLLLAGTGIACIQADVFSHADALDRPASQLVLGSLCAVLALACWTWYAVDNARYLKRNPQVSSSVWSGLYGLSSGVLALVVGGVLLLAGLGPAPAPAAAAARNAGLFWLVNSALALGASVIGNHLWNNASRRLPVTLSGQLILFETLFALLYGYLLQGRWPRLLEWLAMGLLAGGVLLAVRRHGPQVSKAAQGDPA
jgi:drug/metabolite transporter (DMT)-like permease